MEFGLLDFSIREVSFNDVVNLSTHSIRVINYYAPESREEF
jgi:hypothetical protein